MTNSVAPTPVMPKAATAVAMPPSGGWKVKPCTTAPQSKYCGSLNSRKQQLTVSAVKLTTSPIAIFSTMTYLPAISNRTDSPAKVHTKAVMGTPGIALLRISAIPPSIAPTWNRVKVTIPHHIHASHDTLNRGPGTSLKASRVVRPVAIA